MTPLVRCSRLNGMSEPHRLAKWLRHDLGCRGQYGDADLCSCGLAEALSGPTEDYLLIDERHEHGPDEIAVALGRRHKLDRWAAGG